MRTRAPLRANTLAMPLPMPRVPPVTTTARPAIDVNMSAPCSVCAQVRLRQVAAALRVPGAELGGDVGALVRADPREQEQPPEHDERPDLGLVLSGQPANPAVPGQPAVYQPRHLGRMLEEAHRGPEVVQIPA